MARPAPTPVVIPTHSLVASAVRYPGKAARIYQPRQDWQRESYRHYAICGEARFAANFFGHSLSKATLEVAKPTATGPEVQTTGKAVEALALLFNGKDGQAQMLKACGIHLTIAGECFLVGRDVGGEQVWEIVSTLEMKVTGDKWSIEYGDGVPPVDLTDNDVVIRIWNPNPARRIEADSPFRSLLPILSEIEWLTRHIFAQTSSRLAGAGILFLPQDMTFPPPPEIDGKPQETANDADAFMLSLADSMMTPLSDPSSPASMIPIVVTAPADSIDKAKLMHFWSELDAASMDMRSEAIRRFALGMDLPPEQILGMSAGGTGGGESNGVSHWGAWQIDEATIKLHVEPMLDLIANAVTVGYLRNAVDGTDEIVIYNSSLLRLRPDRSKEAFELYDRGVLSIAALLRENGFDTDDLPDEEEHKQWMLRKVASGSTTPEQVLAALGELGVELDIEPEPEEAAREERPAPSLEDHPPPQDAPSAALISAAEGLVFRALERAGNRLRQGGAKPPGVSSFETHCYVKANGQASTLLEDAWSCAPQILEGIAEVEAVVPLLESYCQTLFTEQSPHNRKRLVEWIELGMKA